MILLMHSKSHYALHAEWVLWHSWVAFVPEFDSDRLWYIYLIILLWLQIANKSPSGWGWAGQDRMMPDAPYSENVSRIDNEISEIAERIMEELETASSKDLSEVRYARRYCSYLILNILKIFYMNWRVSPPEQIASSKNERLLKHYCYQYGCRGSILSYGLLLCLSLRWLLPSSMSLSLVR